MPVGVFVVNFPPETTTETTPMHLLFAVARLFDLGVFLCSIGMLGLLGGATAAHAQAHAKWLADYRQLMQSEPFKSLPIELVILPPVSGKSGAKTGPMRMAFSGSAIAVCQLQWNPHSAWLQWFDSFAPLPAQQTAVHQALWTHEVAHCWHKTQGASFEQWVRKQPPRFYHQRREEHADLAALLFTAQRHPEHLPVVLRLLQHLRAHPALDQTIHASHWLTAPQVQGLLSNAASTSGASVRVFNDASDLLELLVRIR